MHNIIVSQKNNTVLARYQAHALLSPQKRMCAYKRVAPNIEQR